MHVVSNPRGAAIPKTARAARLRPRAALRYQPQSRTPTMQSLPLVSATRRSADFTSNRALRGAHCRCSVCGLEFNSLTAFDCHRTGEWLARGCIPINAMAAKGMRLSRSGWWVSRMAIPRGHAIPESSIVSGVLPASAGGFLKPSLDRRELAAEVNG